jgi:hypothetical protein
MINLLDNVMLDYGNYYDHKKFYDTFPGVDHIKHFTAEINAVTWEAIVSVGASKF